MLLLKRRQNQSIIIGDNIKVSIMRINRETVQVGIDAPREIPVFREEISPNNSHQSQPEERISNPHLDSV